MEKYLEYESTNTLFQRFYIKKIFDMMLQTIINSLEFEHKIIV